MGPSEPTRLCPFCQERILAVARKCRHCHEWLPPEAVAAPPGPTSRCPACGTSGLVDIVTSTGWGGYLVRCRSCGISFDDSPQPLELGQAVVRIAVRVLLFAVLLGALAFITLL